MMLLILVTKARNFCFVVYPDRQTVPDDWMEQLSDTRLQIAVSPIHDMDCDVKTGEMKERHYHILLAYPNTTTEKFILENFVSPIGGTGLQVVRDLKGFYAYLSHKYEISKYKYNPDDIIHLNGFSPINFGSTPAESVDILNELFRYIKDNHLISYSALIDKLISEENIFLLNAIRKNTYMVKCYLDSRSKDRFRSPSTESAPYPKPTLNTDETLDEDSFTKWELIQKEFDNFQNADDTTC